MAEITKRLSFLDHFLTPNNSGSAPFYDSCHVLSERRVYHQTTYRCYEGCLPDVDLLCFYVSYFNQSGECSAVFSEEIVSC